MSRPTPADFVSEEAIVSAFAPALGFTVTLSIENFDEADDSVLAVAYSTGTQHPIYLEQRVFPRSGSLSSTWKQTAERKLSAATSERDLVPYALLPSASR